MQRPYFALAVLLGSMTSSVLVVSKVNSQSPAIAVADLPGPASVYGGLVDSSGIRVLLGQSVDCEGEGWSDETGGADLAASDECRQRDCAWSFASSETVDWSTNLWWSLLQDSYHKVQDFVVCGKHCLAVGSYPSGIEQCPAVVVADAELSDVTYLTQGPTNLLACEDYVDCLPEEVHKPVQLPEDCAIWLWQGVDEAQVWAGEQVQGWWALTRDQAEQIRERVAQTIATPVLAVDAHEDQAPVTTFSSNAADDFHEEVLLITAADTLDHLGLRLQEAAQHLRYWAADRIVSKGNSRRVANKSAH